MRTRLLLFSFTFLFSGLFLQVHAKSQCTGYDISFENVTITSVSKTQVIYNVTIKNLGTQTILFNKLTIQNYNSTNTTFDGGDQGAGGALFSFSGGTQVLAGQEYTTAYHAQYTGNLATVAPYLIIQLAYQDGECDVTNNQVVVCTGPNAVFNYLQFSEINSNNGTYNFQIQNVGGDTLFLEDLTLQNYVSVDNTLGGGDAAAGGTLLNYGPQDYLLAGEVMTSAFQFNVASLNSYSYMLTSLTYAHTECSTGENQIAAPLIVTSVETGEGISSIPVEWNMSNQSFVAKNQGLIWSGILTYRLLDTTGRLLTTGTTGVDEQVVLSGTWSMGILVVSDGEQVYSLKVVR